MDNNVHAQGLAEREENENRAGQLVQAQADLREAMQLMDAFQKLEDNFEWQSYMRILITPTIKAEKKQIERLSMKEVLINNENAVKELIYHTAFHDSLVTVSNLKGLREKWQNEVKRLQARVKELSK
jgi:hypothetical protein